MTLLLCRLKEAHIGKKEIVLCVYIYKYKWYNVVI